MIFKSMGGKIFIKRIKRMIKMMDKKIFLGLDNTQVYP